MKYHYAALLIFIFAGMLWTAPIYAKDGDYNEQRAKEIFGALDKDGDKKISRNEWEWADKDKDNKINKKEWERFHFKSDRKGDGWRVIEWYDFNNDGYMDLDEYMYNFSNRKR